MAEGAEYPKAAYRLGGDVDVWGRMMDMRSLIDALDEERALNEGWFLHPNDVPDEEPLIAEALEQPRRRGRPPKARTE